MIKKIFITLLVSIFYVSIFHCEDFEWDVTYIEDFEDGQAQGWYAANGAAGGQGITSYNGDSVWYMNSDWNWIKTQIPSFPSENAIAIEARILYTEVNRVVHFNVRNKNINFVGYNFHLTDDCFTVGEEDSTPITLQVQAGNWHIYRLEEFNDFYWAYIDGELIESGSSDISDENNEISIMMFSETWNTEMKGYVDYIKVETSVGLTSNFTSNVTQGCLPLQVQFEDTSTGTPTSWEWDFDSDGIIDSTEENPTWIYSQLGEYDVTLTCWWDEESDSITKENYISVVEPLDYGLVAYYPFNGNADDESGNGNDGSVNGATLTTDRFGNESNAYSFDGNDYINIGQLSDIHNSEGITVSCWVKKTSSEGISGIVGKWNTSDMTNNSFLLYNGEQDFTNTGSFCVYSIDNDFNRVHSENIIENNEWILLTGTFSSNAGLSNLYKNGTLDATYEIPPTSNNAVNGNTGFDAVIGKWGYANYNHHYFRGSIDDIRIYNRALSEQEILEIYNEIDPMLHPTTVINNINPEIIPWNSISQVINLDDYFSGSDINFTFTGNTMISATVLGGNILSLEPAPDWTGTEYITIRATNDLGYVEQVLRVTVVQTLETSEDFDNEGNIPPGWSVSHYGSTDYPWQAILDEGDDYKLQVMVNTGKTANERLLSPNYNFSNFQNITVSFDSNFLPYSNGQGSFAYTLNNITYTVVETFTTPSNELKSYSIPNLTGKANVKFRWIYGNNTVNTGQDNYWDIDDFNIYGDFFDNESPSEINGLTLNSQTSHSATLSWEESSDVYFERYELYVSQDGTVDIDDQLWSVEQDSTLFYITTTETTITNLDNGDYWIAIRAVDQSNNSSNLSDPISIHIDNESPVFSSPIPQLQPEPLWQNSRTAQIGCSINDLSNIDISSINYRIDHNGNGIYDDTELWLLIPDSTRIIHERDEVNLSFEVTFDSDGILPFEFRASDIYGNIAYSGVYNQEGIDDDWVVRISTLPPAEITTFFVQEVADSTVQLAWETVANISLLGYRIHYSTVTDVDTTHSYWDWNNDPNMSNPSSELISTTISGLNPGTRYYFLLLALDGIGGSFEYPEIITAMTSSSAPPETPDNLTVEISEGLIILDWDDVIVDIFGNNIVISYYEVYVGDHPDFECNFNSLIGTVNESYLELPDVVEYADKLFFKIRANSGMIRRINNIQKYQLKANIK